ncbi:hypothetical protein Q7M73_05235 [Candidatus Liberibacter asiaticus]
MGVIEILGSIWAIQLAKTDSWMGMADWSLIAPLIMQGFKLTHFFIIPIGLLSVIYMIYARRTLDDKQSNSNHHE